MVSVSGFGTCAESYFALEKKLHLLTIQITEWGCDAMLEDLEVYRARWKTLTAVEEQTVHAVMRHSTNKKAAVELGVTANTVGQRLHVAKTKLVGSGGREILTAAYWTLFEPPVETAVLPEAQGTGKADPKSSSKVVERSVPIQSDISVRRHWSDVTGLNLGQRMLLFFALVLGIVVMFLIVMSSINEVNDMMQINDGTQREMVKTHAAKRF